MHALGINFLRLPLGYWNVIDMTEDPEAPADEASRMGNLSKIMKSSKDYQKYIQRILDLAQTYNIKVMLDLHGAPGNQGGTGHAGCYTNKIPYWDTDKNKEWTTKAVVAVAEICKNAGDVCYGVELLNEPAFDLDRVHLREWY
jgi:glucan 1,3-beta-glucosidase